MDGKILYVSTIDDSAGEVARRYGLGIEIAQFCTAGNLDENLPAVHREVASQVCGVQRRLLHGPFNELFPCAIDPLARRLADFRYSQALDMAHCYCASKVILHGGYSPRLYYPVWYVEQSIIFWREFLEKHPDGAEICLENVMEEEPQMLLDIVKGVNHPRLRLCLDVGHVNAYSAVPASEWMEQWEPWLSHLHLHNNDGSADTHSALDQGTLPMEQLLRKIPAGATATLELPQIGEAICWLRSRGMLEG